MNSKMFFLCCCLIAVFCVSGSSSTPILSTLERGWTSIKETVSSLNIGGRIDSALASARNVNVSSSIDSFISSLKSVFEEMKAAQARIIESATFPDSWKAVFNRMLASVGTKCPPCEKNSTSGSISPTTTTTTATPKLVVASLDSNPDAEFVLPTLPPGTDTENFQKEAEKIKAAIVQLNETACFC